MSTCQNCGFQFNPEETRETIIFDDEEGWDNYHLSCYYNVAMNKRLSAYCPEGQLHLRAITEQRIKNWRSEGKNANDISEILYEYLDSQHEAIVEFCRLTELKHIDFQWYLGGKTSNPIYHKIETDLMSMKWVNRQPDGEVMDLIKEAYVKGIEDTQEKVLKRFLEAE